MINNDKSIFLAVVPLLGVWLVISGALLRGGAASGGSVPPPVAAETGRYLVGAIHCPLWDDGRHWQSVASFPDRKSLLGWYDEGDTEVTDWEIKWALEHGISFFLTCWYREAGNEGTTPFSPPSGPATGSFNGLHAKSKFLAASRK